MAGEAREEFLVFNETSPGCPAELQVESSPSPTCRCAGERFSQQNCLFLFSFVTEYFSFAGLGGN